MPRSTDMSRLSALALMIFVLASGTLLAQNPRQRIFDVEAENLCGNLTPSLGRTSYYTVTVRNNYNGSVGGVFVELLSGETLLGSTYLSNIIQNTSSDALLTWIPQYTGVYEVHARITLSGDLDPTNDVTPAITLTVQPQEIKLGTIGGLPISSRIPLDFSDRNSVCDVLYRQTELNYSGIITQIVLYDEFPEALNAQPVRFWMGTTVATATSQWFDFANLTEVFDGTVDFPAGPGAVAITLQQPFWLPPGQNLILRSQHCFGMLTYDEGFTFRGLDVNSLRGRIKSYPNLIDPAAPGDFYNLVGGLPQTGFLFAPETGGPILSAVPEEVNFGLCRTDFSHSQTLHVNNIGVMALTVTGITLQTPAGDFSLVALPDFPLTLASTAGFSLDVHFQPQILDLQTASLAIATSDGTYNITLKGSGLDPTLYDLPHTENFDTLPVGTLPSDWSAIVQSSYPHAYVMTMSERTHSAPRAAEIYNHFDTSATLLLVSPPLADSIAINQLRLVFWHFGYSDSTLRIGVMDDPHDPDSFVEVSSIVQGYSWGQYVVPLAAYTGTGRYVAFRYGSGTLSKLILDDIRIERVPAADLEALSLGGEMLVSNLDQNVSHTLTLRNVGTQPQSAYSVQLFAGDSLVCEVPGIPLAPGEQGQIILPWDPPFGIEETNLTATVVLAGDAFLDNNSSDPFPVWIDGETLYFLGDGNEYYPIPFDTGHHSILWETVIPAAELEWPDGFMGIVDRLWLYGYHHTQYIPDFPIRVWLGGTLRDNLEEGWIPAGELDLVFNGGVDMDDYDYPLPIDLQTPFAYYGGNLVMLVYQPTWTALTASNYFLAQTAGANRTRRYWSEGTAPNPYDPPAPTPSQLNGRYPRLVFAHLTPTIISGRFHLQATDQDGVPLEGAVLRFHYASYAAATDPAGQIHLPDVLPGFWQVTVAKAGYASQIHTVEIGPDQDCYLTVALTAVANSDPQNSETGPTRLLGNSPNPFTDATRIAFNLNEPSPVSIRIYNLRGQLIRVLAAERLDAGHHALVWDGKDSSGSEVSPGLYLYRFHSHEASLTGKMLRLE